MTFFLSVLMILSYWFRIITVSMNLLFLIHSSSLNRGARWNLLVRLVVYLSVQKTLKTGMSNTGIQSIESSTSPL